MFNKLREETAGIFNPETPLALPERCALCGLSHSN
jgi:hypothetical protein